MRLIFFCIFLCWTGKQLLFRIWPDVIFIMLQNIFVRFKLIEYKWESCHSWYYAYFWSSLTRRLNRHMVQILRLPAVLAIVQTDGNSIVRFTLLITAKQNLHSQGSIPESTAGNAIWPWFSQKRKLNAMNVIRMSIRLQQVLIVAVAILQIHGLSAI